MQTQVQSHSSRNTGELRFNMAAAMIGRTVGLWNGGKKITRGVVSAVFTEAGRPKLVVDGLRYDPSQILTVTPTASC